MRCIFHESGIFSQVQPCSSSILRGNRTVSTVPGLCDSDIWHFLVARRAFVTCFRRVTIDLAGICKGKLEIVTCFVRHKKRLKLFLTREARYDFEFSLANASENDHNAPKARYDCTPCTVKCSAPFCSVSPAVAQCAFSN